MPNLSKTKTHPIRDLVLICILSLALLGFIEICVRLFIPQELQTRYKNNQSLGLSDPALGHVLRPNSTTEQSGPEYRVHYDINAQGLRDERVYGVKQPDKKRILLLGDSFTFAYGVEYAKSWPVLLEQALRKQGFNIEIIKAGIPAYDTAKEVLFLEKTYKQFQPDLVILTFVPNDLFTNEPIPDDRDVTSASEAMTHGEKGSSLHIVTLLKRALISSDFIYTRLYGLSGRANYYRVPESPELQKRISTTKDLLLRGKKFCAANGIPLIVLTLPQQVQVLLKARGGPSYGMEADLPDTAFAEFSSQNGIPWISATDFLSSHYRSSRQELYYRLDGHLNSNGNELAARYFADKLPAELKSSKS